MKFRIQRVLKHIRVGVHTKISNANFILQFKWINEQTELLSFLILIKHKNSQHNLTLQTAAPE